MNPNEPMPRRDEVDPAFDGHPERPFASLTAEEKLDWLWTCMELLAAVKRERTPEPGV